MPVSAVIRAAGGRSRRGGPRRYTEREGAQCNRLQDGSKCLAHRVSLSRVVHLVAPALPRIAIARVPHAVAVEVAVRCETPPLVTPVGPILVRAVDPPRMRPAAPR